MHSYLPYNSQERKYDLNDKENQRIIPENPPNENKKTPSIIKNLFFRSEEIAKMTQDVSDIHKNVDRRDQVRNKVYAFNPQANAPNEENPNMSRSKGDLSLTQEVAKVSKVKSGSVKVDIKNEYTEMKENVQCLEKLLSYQNNFYQECNKEIDTVNQKIGEKSKVIQETNAKINTIAEEMQESARLFDIEYQKLLQEAELLEKECAELKQLNEEEDIKYNNTLNEVKNKEKELNFKIQENMALELRITKEEEEVTQKEKTLEELKGSLLHYQRLQHDLENDLKEIFEKKKYLNNELQELKGNIRVYCRIRPYLQNDPADEIADEMLKIKSCTSMDLTVPQSFLKSENNIKEYKFNFEHLFDQSAKQVDVFNELSQLIQSALDGYNVCIFAYGQTGSGKTYTMEGYSLTEEGKGIIMRSVGLIFDQIAYMRNFGWEYKVYVSFQEIYNEQARDLLTATQDPKVDISCIEVKNERELYPLLRTASENRAVAETQCNEHSSRSHSIFQLKLRGRNEAAKQESNGTLNLIDLAGSERLAVSKAEGERLKETQSINKSLTSLGDVITALANKDKHIPYRNSKLTYVLQPYLGGDSKTLMLVNLSPLISNFHQTLCTLRFAAKVKSCEVGTAKKHLKNM